MIKIHHLFLGLLMMSSVVHSESLVDIIDDIDNDIDLRCELNVEAGAALQNITSELENEVNDRIASVLDAYNLECLTSLLSIGGINIPGFNTIINLNFCEIVRDEILNRNGNFTPGNFSSIPQNKVDEVKSHILKRAKQQEDLIKALERGRGG